MAASTPAMGRHRIDGLVKFNLRFLARDKEALERIVEAERERRGHPSFSATDAIREAIAQWIAAHDPKAKRRKG